MTFAPGKIQPNAISGPWNRSLEADLERLRHHYSIDVLVCLLEDHEMASLRIEALPDRCAAHGLELLRLPVADGDVSSPSAMKELQTRVAALRQQGRSVAFHWKGGLGRAGTAAACCLIHAGVDARAALSRVRSERRGAVETARQERFVATYS